MTVRLKEKEDLIYHFRKEEGVPNACADLLVTAASLPPPPFYLRILPQTHTQIHLLVDLGLAISSMLLW